jgi:hypothetical protein
VKFNKLHLTSFSSKEYVPVIGDVMPVRWSFEALAVEQFKNNAYEKHFFKNDLDESQNDYYASFLIDKLKSDLVVCSKYLDSIAYKDLVINKFRRMNNYIDQLSGLAKIVPGKWKNELNAEYFNQETKEETLVFLDSLKRVFFSLRKLATSRKNAVSDSLIKAIGKEKVVILRDNYENKKLIFLVLDQETFEKTYDQENKIIQKYNPGYMKATSKFGRAHFYAPVKKLGNLEIDTYWFNIILIWIVTLVLYIALYFNLLQKAIKYFETPRFTKSDIKRRN